jgi:hypothetical protein
VFYFVYNHFYCIIYLVGRHHLGNLLYVPLATNSTGVLIPLKFERTDEIMISIWCVVFMVTVFGILRTDALLVTTVTAIIIFASNEETRRQNRPKE